MESASTNTWLFPSNMETKVNAFDHSDINERNEKEMERWQLGQITSKIEHDKPLIVISMWTFRGMECLWWKGIWMSMQFIWCERGGRKLAQRCIFLWDVHTLSQNLSFILVPFSYNTRAVCTHKVNCLICQKYVWQHEQLYMLEPGRTLYNDDQNCSFSE